MSKEILGRGIFLSVRTFFSDAFGIDFLRQVLRSMHGVESYCRQAVRGRIFIFQFPVLIRDNEVPDPQEFLETVRHLSSPAAASVRWSEFQCGGIGASCSLLIGTRVNQRVRNKICGRQGSDLRVDLVAAIRVSLTARHTLHSLFGRLKRIDDAYRQSPFCKQYDRREAIQRPRHLVYVGDLQIEPDKHPDNCRVHHRYRY